MPYYHFSWVKNAVTTSWWVEEHPDDESASRRAGELEEEEYARFFADPFYYEDDGDSYPDPGGILVEPATEEYVRAYRERVRLEQEKRRRLDFPLIPPDDLIIW